jgi:hypothetical protein
MYASVKDIRKEKRRNARIKGGLTADNVDIKDDRKDPSTQYVKSPTFNSKSELNLNRKLKAY